MKKYKQNLRVERINRGETHLTLVDWNVGGRTTSPTTSKHINYVARELNLTIIR